MEQTKQMQKEKQAEEQVPARPVKKQFHGFSMGFLLILLAVVVGLYIVCTIIVG